MKKYAAVGTGGRIGGMFLFPLVDIYGADNQIVALCDISRIRSKLYVEMLAKDHGVDYPIALYHSGEFADMLVAHKPDEVIVCSMDSTHAEYIVLALEAGCDVIVEKPLAVTVAQLQAIDAAVRRTGRRVRVAFNYRWTPPMTKVWEILRTGEIGTIQHVNFEYLLDTNHGADYFRRWHARMENSGGLLIHKATHHFDLVNWWINSIPEHVSAHGKLAFYGKDNAIARGDERLTQYSRYREAPVEDPFRISMPEPGKGSIYADAEEETGYIRDRNVFRDDINIFDTMSVTARYRSGVLLTYSLLAYSPYEGFRVCITGDRGRLELTERHAAHLITGQTDAELSREQRLPAEVQQGYGLVVQKHFGQPEKVEIPERAGDHWGADPLLQEQFFSPQPTPDHARRLACHEQGMASVLLGLAANASIAEGRTITVNDLVPLRVDTTQLSDLL